MFKKEERVLASRTKTKAWFKNWRLFTMVIGLIAILPILSGCDYFERDHDMSKVFSQQVDKRLASMRNRLMITTEQTPQWDRLAATIKTEGQIVADRHRDLMMKGRVDASKINGIEHLESFQTMMEANMVSMKKVIESAKPLYAVLNSEQKKIADRMVTHPSMGWREGHRKWFNKDESKRESKHDSKYESHHE